MKTSTNIKSFRGIYELDSVEEPHKAIQKKNWNNLTLIKLDKVFIQVLTQFVYNDQF